MHEEPIKSLLWRELGTLNYRERIYLKESLDMGFVREELQRLNRRIRRMRWMMTAVWLLFVAVMFMWVKLGVPQTPALLASVLFIIFVSAMMLNTHVEKLRRRELIFRVFRRLGCSEPSETEL
ncbi:MAG: hypothetical protein D0433_00475 [Candidatus Thermochlorobacter aerophilum]|jgi:hypothetical protein|uniref:Uncharacterized protein n=1 Tax=Candidatus Thermochlorobacter aerophilus TaxID=1868324 RepID=A0A395M5P7_9BACT|nr:MAG: hypothetical protein D0433_01615 [Candidatus Thermochlorobacter aerophilum]RFM25538.1 MAG: hypothetical protein D0433_00475 [Candidatus Thermochlorobacter aerophilum]